MSVFKPPGQGEYLTIPEASELLRISDRKLWELCKFGGGPPFFRVGSQYRFSAEAIRAWAQQQSVEK